MSLDILACDSLVGIEGFPDLPERLKALLAWADDQFVPPLSARDSSTQTDLSNCVAAESRAIDDYYNALLEQRFLLVIEDDPQALAGFMSYRVGFECPYVEAETCTYVSTVIVDEPFRGRALTGAMYRALFKLPGVSGTVVATRTWSGNDAHLHILERLGFALIKRLPNDRGPGIDTVYYAYQT